MFYCYKITNAVNGKVYIGKTKDIRNRWANHRSRAFNPKDKRYFFPLSHAIRKYGVDNFSFDVLQICETEDEVNNYEETYIVQFRANINIYGDEFGYNMTNGGERNTGRKQTEETRAKMSAAHTGILHTQEAKNKIGAAHLGMKHSEETKVVLRDAFIGEKSSTAKLDWDKISEIRKKYASGLYSHQKLADEYGVSPSNIGSIIRNESWRI